MNAESKISQVQATDDLENKILEVTRSPFSRAGHLWLICHLGGYLNARRLPDKDAEATRRQLVASIKGYLDEGFERRRGKKHLEAIAEVTEDADDDETRTIAAAVQKIAAKTTSSRRKDETPIQRRSLSPAMALIRRHCEDKRVLTWLRHSSRAFQVAEKVVANVGQVDQADVDTATDALVPTRYMVGWLRDVNRARRRVAKTEQEIKQQGLTELLIAKGAPDVACEIVTHRLAKTKFSLGELSAIHDAFLERVLTLPSLNTKDAAKLIGVTVDRVHRMAALGEVDSFFIRRRIPRSEVTRRKKGSKAEAPRPAEPVSPEISSEIVHSLRRTKFSILHLLKMQDALERRIKRVSYPLKTAIENMGFTEVHFHLLLERVNSYPLECPVLSRNLRHFV